MFPKMFDVKNLNGKNGFVIEPVKGSNKTGCSLDSAGDMNGDGIDDFIIGAFDVGEAYVIYGTKNLSNLSTPIFKLESLNGNNGFTIVGPNNSSLGWDISGNFDINGDGINDFALSDITVNSNCGSVYIVFGAKNFSHPFNVQYLNGSNGFVVKGLFPGDQLGASISGTPDINGDSIDDFIIGASFANEGRGLAYIIFGSRDIFPAEFDLRSLNKGNGFSILGLKEGSFLGQKVTKIGDFNKDSIADFAVAAPYFNGYSGQTYVVFGSERFPLNFDLNTLNGSNGFSINVGLEGYIYHLGSTMDGLVDINHDFTNDLILNSQVNSYVIYGTSKQIATPLTLTNLNGDNGFCIIGTAGNVGEAVSGSIDLNGDKINDMILSESSGPTNEASSYIIFGNSNFNSTFNVVDLKGNQGVLIKNSKRYIGNFIVKGIGDIDKDGLGDVALSSSDCNFDSGITGEVYILLSSTIEDL